MAAACAADDRLGVTLTQRRYGGHGKGGNKNGEVCDEGSDGDVVLDALWESRGTTIGTI